MSFPPLLLIFIIAAGGLAVAIYHRLDSSFDLRPKAGFRVSALSAFLALIVTSLINVFAFFTRAGREMLTMAMSNMSDPQQTDAIKKLLEQVQTPRGVAQFALLMIVNILMFVALSGIGGAIGASLFGRKGR